MFKPGRYNLTIIHTKGLILLLAVIAVTGICLWHAASRRISDQIALERTGRERDYQGLAAKLNSVEAKLDRVNGQMDELHAGLEEFTPKTDHQSLTERVGKIEERLDRLTDRLTLLGALHNENFSAVAAGRPKEVIFIGRTWTINRLPRYLNMSNEDVEWLSRFVDRKAAIAQTAPQVPEIK